MKVGACPTLILVLAAGTLSCSAQSREQNPYTQAASAARGEAGAAPASLAEAERRRATGLSPMVVEGQPLAANIHRVVEALDYLGAPLPVDLRTDLMKADRARDAIRLKEQIYPGANGSKGWPTWTLPVLRWAQAQGGVGGYAHSGSGLQVDPVAATTRLFEQLDANRDGRLAAAEAAVGLLPEPFAEIDTDRDGFLVRRS
jgi:hypothetical protein